VNDTTAIGIPIFADICQFRDWVWFQFSSKVRKLPHKVQHLRLR
jgi:hypothetical protein